MFARKKGGFLPLPYFRSSFTKSFLIPHFPISERFCSKNISFFLARLFKPWLNKGRGAVRRQGMWEQIMKFPQKSFQSTANCTGAHAHCCTKCRTKYKHKKHIVLKKINRDTKNFPNTVTNTCISA